MCDVSARSVQNVSQGAVSYLTSVRRCAILSDLVVLWAQPDQSAGRLLPLQSKLLFHGGQGPHSSQAVLHRCRQPRREAGAPMQAQRRREADSLLQRLGDTFLSFRQLLCTPGQSLIHSYTPPAQEMLQPRAQCEGVSAQPTLLDLLEALQANGPFGLLVLCGCGPALVTQLYIKWQALLPYLVLTSVCARSVPDIAL